MLDDGTALNARIAERVRELRAVRGLSLDALASRSGVSRSMISLIERAETSPTAVVLEKLAAGLGVALAALFDPPAASSCGPVVRRADQPVWRDPGSGYVRRNISPPSAAKTLQIVEVTFPARGRIAFDNRPDSQLHQQVWVLEGTIEVSAGTEQHRLNAGDCMAMQLDQPTMFHNPTSKPARYAVVLV
jgi:transcriptional regulator with XRE-family HTH domain